MTRLLILAVRSYLLIPPPARHAVCLRLGRTKPTARTALTDLRAGKPRAIRNAISEWDHGGMP